jgi:hypothetical protein
LLLVPPASSVKSPRRHNVATVSIAAFPAPPRRWRLRTGGVLAGASVGLLTAEIERSSRA